MTYIDLHLKKHNKDDYELYTLPEIIDHKKIIVVLGSPGSGKTSILKKYEEENKNTQFLKIKNFLKLEGQVRDETSVLLLDGLDEYRSVTNDKTFVLTELGHKINQLKDIKIVISCRELDWYGEADENALKDQIKESATVYDVLPLDQSKKVEMANVLGIDDEEDFVEKYTDLGFLENPQMFSMIADMYKAGSIEEFSSRQELYYTFIKHAREDNLEHSAHAQIELEPDEFIKLVGYIAFYYMFANIDEINDDFLDEICDGENGYSKETLVLVRKSKLFQDNLFIHRTIAEFTLAHYLFKHVISRENPISKKRVQTLFVKNNRIPTELRGTYAWLCSLSEDEEFIVIDPYYQAVHGDSALFSNDLKQKVLLAVKEYAKTNPWFFQFGHSVDLDGFYNEGLDEFFMSELNEALEIENHYKIFVINAIVKTKTLSPKMYAFLKEKMVDSTIPSYVKDDIVEAFKTDENFLIEVLDLIKDKKIIDKGDRLKETILRIAYPHYISSKDIIPYLMMYEDKVMGHCYYLYETAFDDKYNLIDSIHKACFNENREPKLVLKENIKTFVEDYFLEVILQYEDELSAQEIYNIIKHFKSYYNWYDKLDAGSYRYRLTDKEKLNEEKSVKLANELFSIYLDEMLTEENERFRIYNFNYFFSYKAPTSQSDILFSKMSQDNDPDKNKELFLAALAYSPKNEDNSLVITEQIETIVSDYHLKEVFESYLNPTKTEWELEDEKYRKEQQEKDTKTLEENEAYFSSRTDGEIQKNFNDLHYITNILFIKSENKKQKYLKAQTFERLQGILKQAIFENLIDENLLTVDSLVTTAPGARRYIDNMYYVSSVLNSGRNIDIENKEFLKYLYLVNLSNTNTGNIIKGDFLEQLESSENEFVIELLKEALEKLLSHHYSKVQALVMSYVAQEDQLDILKELYMSHYLGTDSLQENILHGFLQKYNFFIALDDLKILDKLDTNDENSELIGALLVFITDEKSKLTMNMAIALQSLFEYKRKHFLSLDSSVKVKLIHYLISVFDTEDSIENVSGFQSGKAICGSFLRHDALDLMETEELYELRKNHYRDDDIWSNKILHKINELEQKGADSGHVPYSIEKIKNFSLSGSIVDYLDFFEDIILKLEDIKATIESNRINDKDPFYNHIKGVKTKKTEEACRDVILQRLNDKYGYDLDVTKEKYEANNRVDMNVKYRSTADFEIQVECKRDDNQELYTGIKDQLIDKYFSAGVQYGVYLVFYFGFKKDKEKMLQRIQESIPTGYVDRVKLICIDLCF